MLLMLMPDSLNAEVPAKRRWTPLNKAREDCPLASVAKSDTKQPEAEDFGSRPLRSGAGICIHELHTLRPNFTLLPWLCTK